MELGEMGSGCEDDTCDLASSFGEDCVNQECPVFGMIELVCVTVICIPLMLLGLFGNILTILVVWLRPQMRSSTYLYLSSMAVSDLLILLLMPLDLYKLWRPRPWLLGDLVCKLSVFLSECCTFCTILHITFLSLERYLAVCWPITAKTLVTRRRTRVLIGCLWLGAAISAAPVLVMVGVEEVGGKEGIGGWREDGGLTSREGEHEGGHAKVAMVDAAGLEVRRWDENETKGWSERIGGFFQEEGGTGAVPGETKGSEREKREKRPAGDYRDKDEGLMQVDGKKQNKMKEDEGGGWEEHTGGNHEGEIDRRECRCSDYAATSGLLSAMTILSNMYFLIPFCVLGLVYSLIGRTLWLRPQSSRKDQSHRHTVKMLGVIVLAFVLCWLPYHVGRTIFSFSFTAYTQEAHTNPRVDADAYSGGTDGDADEYSTIQPVGRACAEPHAETPSEAEKRPARAPTGDHTRAATKMSQNNDPDAQSGTHTDEPLYLHIVSQHLSILDSAAETDAHVETQLGQFAEDNDTTAAHRPHTADTCATPAALHNDTHSDNSHAHPDQNAFFHYYLSQYLNLVSSVLFYLSAAVNPLLYNLMSARYRHAVHSLIHKRSLTQPHRLRATITARHSTTTL